MTKLTQKRTVTTQFQPEEMTHHGNVEKCVNLRSCVHNSHKALTPAPQAEPRCECQLTPLVALPHTGEWLMHTPPDAEGSTLLYSVTEGKEPEQVLRPDNEPLCAVPTPSGAIIMTSEGPVAINRGQEGWSSGDTKPFMSPITVSAAMKGTLTKSVLPVNMDITISGQTATPSNESLIRVRNAMLTTYETLSIEALAGGVWIQPIGVRHKVLDKEGNELWRSPVSIISADGWQCVQSMSGNMTGSGNSFATPTLHIAAKAYAINVQIEDLPETDPWHELASTVVIEATPQLHPIIADRLPRTLISGLTSNSPKLNIWMPGVQPESNATLAIHNSTLKWLAVNPDTIMTQIGRVDMKGGSRTVQLTPINSPSVNEETAKVNSVSKQAQTNTNTTDDNPLAQLVTSGQRFRAGCVVQNGDTTIWGNIATTRYGKSQQMPPSATTISTQWQAALRIYADGSNYVVRYSGADHCPTALSPIILIEHARATAATFYVKRGDTGLIYEATIELSPMPNGSMSGFISPNLEPVELTLSDITILPAATAYAGSTDKMPGAVIVASSNEPLRAICGGVCSQGEIKALATAVKSQSSWDFSRCHIYAFANDGIYTVSANTATKKVSASRIDPRGVNDSNAVSATPSGVVALAGNNIVICTASSVKPATRIPGGLTHQLKQVAWHSSDNELYFTDTQGNVAILNDSGWHHVLIPERVEHLHPFMDTVWLCGTESCFTIGETDECNIEWECTVALDEPAKAMVLKVPMCASQFNGTVQLRAHNGAGSQYSLPVTELKIKGTLNSPLTARIMAPWRRELLLSIKARVSRDFMMRAPSVTISSLGLR